jgi:hypothetical protein
MDVHPGPDGCADKHNHLVQRCYAPLWVCHSARSVVDPAGEDVDRNKLTYYQALSIRMERLTAVSSHNFDPKVVKYRKKR